MMIKFLLFGEPNEMDSSLKEPYVAMCLKASQKNIEAACNVARGIVQRESTWLNGLPKTSKADPELRIDTCFKFVWSEGPMRPVDRTILIESLREVLRTDGDSVAHINYLAVLANFLRKIITLVPRMADERSNAWTLTKKMADDLQEHYARCGFLLKGPNIGVVWKVVGDLCDTMREQKIEDI